MKNKNVTKCNFIPNKMDVDLNMLPPVMLNRIVGEVNNTDVITINQEDSR